VQELTGIAADLTCLGKVLGGGLPVAAFGGRREIMDKLAASGGVYQAGTSREIHSRSLRVSPRFVISAPNPMHGSRPSGLVSKRDFAASSGTGACERR
jgi:hypothetical protein